MRASGIALGLVVLWAFLLVALAVTIGDSPFLPVFMGLAGFFIGVGLICAAIENKR